MSLASGRSLSRLQFAEFAGALGAAAGVAAVTGSSSASSKNMGTLLVREGTPTENRAIAAGLSMAASVISSSSRSCRCSWSSSTGSCTR